MITSTFLPAVAPPLPPPLALPESPDVRPATTPTTPAMSAMTATSDSENFTRVLVLDISPLSLPRNRPTRLRERFLGAVEPRDVTSCCQEDSHSVAVCITFRRHRS